MIAREEVAGLVRLRTFLEHALRLAEDRSEPGRHSALVALDGVCEYALFLSGHRVSIQVRERAGFVETLSAVEEKLASWRHGSRRSVMQMRGARNQAQHAGALPDDKHMPEWADATETFVKSLVEAAFDVPLGDVLLADAIDDKRLRGHIATAERALEQAEPLTAFESAVTALLEARQRWRNQQADAYGYMPSEASFDDDPRWMEPSRRSEDYADVGVFASDLGEYHRLIATRRQVAEGVPIVKADARRALLFVYGWILRWQRFDAAYPRERWREYWQNLRPPTHGDGLTPIIVDIDVKEPIQLGADEHNQVIVRVANVPEEGRGTWGTEIDGVLADVLSSNHLERACIRTGRVELWNGELTFLLDLALTPGVVGHVLTQTVDELTRTYKARVAEAEERDSQARVVGEGFSEVFATTAPELFRNVRVRRELRRDGETIVVLVDLNGSMDELHHVVSIFSGRGGELAGATSTDGSLAFDAFDLNETGLIRLHEAMAAAAEYVKHSRDFMARRESERHGFESGLRSAAGLEV